MFVRSLRPLLVLALALGFCLPPLAAGVPELRQPVSVWAAWLGPFPQQGSDAAKADLAIQMWQQRTRTPEEVARAQDEVNLRLDLLSRAAGRDLAHTLPRTQALLAGARSTLGRLSWSLKLHYGRLRPFNSEPLIQPAVYREPSFSCPSGHASTGMLYAALLARLAPERREALLERGRQIGNDRVLGGVHWPSDVVAGQRLGEAVAEQWLADPAHLAELEAVRAAEWRPGGH